MATNEETSDNLCAKVVQKYNNMKLVNRWKKTEEPASKVISVLVMEMNDLKATLTNGTKPRANTTMNNNQSWNKKSKLFASEWCIENKGESCTRYSTTWHWCPHHKRDRLFDRIYMPHKACDHDAWKKKKEERWGKKLNWSPNQLAIALPNSNSRIR